MKLLDLLVLKKQEIVFVMSSPARLVQEAVDLMKPGLEESGICAEISCDAGECLLEPDLIISLLINLIDNAKKARNRAENCLSVQNCRKMWLHYRGR